MSDPLDGLDRKLAGAPTDALTRIDKLSEPERQAPWLPNPGPQTQAYRSKADLLLYGGAAGGGKSELLLGLALTRHRRSVIFRRAFVDMAGVEQRLLEIAGSREGWRSDKMIWRRDKLLLEFGALDKPGAEQSWQGRAHDFVGFDEGAQLTAAKAAFVLGWLRSSDPGQRCRAVIASNPPRGGEGQWLIEWFAPWLDPVFAHPAQAGELRWAVTRGEATVWVDGPDPVVIGGETYKPLSRSFIPALLEDNPYLADSGYRARLQNLPEPLRSQLLKGDFLAGRTCLTLTMDIFYLHPEHRDGSPMAAIRLFRAVEREARRRGVQRWFVGAKLHKDAGRLFEFLRFEPVETYYSMWLED